MRSRPSSLWRGSRADCRRRRSRAGTAGRAGRRGGSDPRSGTTHPRLARLHKLTPSARAELAVEICEHSRAWAVAACDVAEIDALNILQASLLAMQRAVVSLAIPPEVVWFDGLYCPVIAYPARAIVDGDRLIAAIAAASILAKTERDAMLVALDRSYPAYGFARHKGYATPEHVAALRGHGPCPEHRRHFAHVDQLEFDF